MKYAKMLETGARELGIELSPTQIDQFLRYKQLLLQWNEKMNLTAIEEEVEIITKHFLDSITCLNANYFQNNCKMIDIGTGAGFPGIPIKTVRPDINVTLLDSLNKRIHFLNEVIQALNFSNTEAIHGRAEDLAKNKLYRENFDIAISRAVANLSVLAEYCLPFVKNGGFFISMKGPNVEEELKQARNAINILGGEIINLNLIKIPFTEITHSLVIIKKVRQCPTKYPRKAGKPAKEPLK